MASRCSGGTDPKKVTEAGEPDRERARSQRRTRRPESRSRPRRRLAVLTPTPRRAAKDGVPYKDTDGLVA
ncbi:MULTISPECIES: hypothetical protein [unclassified Streptomyces]|uniref:Uncharacterized protein n=1 Tax=Streptomyces sp. NBC_00119 TaxID=2975659 RepID=A0AAU1UC86_9ACTN|nr:MULTISPECIES: hypothetical protein [unclassified Streptomyces]MCX4644264.1 hypothetical protein [Streptomyces sp. NBC_01446]MCX5325376.1 hypothetical protein [Streptomyces sp. NBC_00120]